MAIVYLLTNIENGKKYVEVEQKATTHRGELSAFGTSVAELPSKG